MIECIRCKKLVSNHSYKRHYRNCIKGKECPECKIILNDLKYDNHVKRCNKEFTCKNCNIMHSGKYHNLNFCSKFCGLSFSTKNRDNKSVKEATCTFCDNIYIINTLQSNSYICCKCRHKVNILASGKNKGKFKKEKFCVNCNVNKPEKYYKLCEDCKKIKYSEYELYKKSCLFTHNIYEFPDEYDLDLILKYGWYKVTKNKEENNLKGVSRDHIYSISEGFKNNIDPNIIKHPANCRLIRHNENQSKGFKCSIIIEELIQKIEEWNKRYNISTSGRVV